MASQNLEERVRFLESELTRLRELVEANPLPWWKKWSGAFLNDPYFEQAMKHGRAYRDSTRPKGRKRRKKP